MVVWGPGVSITPGYPIRRRVRACGIHRYFTLHLCSLFDNPCMFDGGAPPPNYFLVNSILGADSGLSLHHLPLIFAKKMALAVPTPSGFGTSGALVTTAPLVEVEIFPSKR